MRPVRIPDVTPSNLLSAGAMNNCAAPLAAFADVARPSRTYHVHWQATRGVLIYRWSRASLWKCTARMSVRLCADAVAPALRSVTCGVRTSCLLAGSRAAEWDAVLSCFFLDTAPNIIEYLETIFAMLKPGGFLINFGSSPLTRWLCASRR